APATNRARALPRPGTAVPLAVQRRSGGSGAPARIGGAGDRAGLECLRGHGFPAEKHETRALLPRRTQGTMMDLSTRYLGLNLRNPLVASASPLSKTVDGVRRLADAGVGAVVLYSLFEEQVRREARQNARLAEAGTE